MTKKINLMKENWDYLIILDACRYDYFEKYYEQFLTGDLKKIISPASCTKEWLKKTFSEKYDDVIYVSANPHINSKLPIKGFNAVNHFYKIIDVWDFGWDKELGTVHPKEVNDSALETILKFPDKRIIIHYMQPHYPFLNLGNVSERQSFGIFKKNKPLDLFFKIIKKLLGNRYTWKIKNALKIHPDEPLEAVLQKYGSSGLIEGYEYNLEVVLNYVERLISLLDGTVIITSDHGELLGERGEFGHPCNKYFLKLLEVPYFTPNKYIMK